MNEIKCYRCGRQLTVWEATSRSSVVHEGSDEVGYTPHRWCGVCSYRYADPEDYGKPHLWRRLLIMWRRWWEPKAEPIDDDSHSHWNGEQHLTCCIRILFGRCPFHRRERHA